MSIIKTMFRRIRYGNYADSDTYIKYLRSLGCQIGEDTTIYSPYFTCIDTTRPWLINIGNHVRITRGVTILTHGYDWSVLKGKYGEVLGSAGGVSIGDNVFIGMQTTILKGTHIGNNVIIGANSLVNKDIPDDCVVAGNPCRVIMGLDEYYEKRVKAQLTEASEMIKKYRKTYKKEPDEYVLREHFWLFTDETDDLHEEYKKMNRLVDNECFSIQKMKKHKKLFNSMNDFLSSIPWEVDNRG